MKKLVLLLAALFVVALPAITQEITIDALKTSEPISKYIYGQFIEHLGRCIYGGIWSEMLEDRKFHFPVTADYKPWEKQDAFEKLVASPWRMVGDTASVKMTVASDWQETAIPELTGTGAGLEQLDLGLVAGKSYTGRIVLSSAEKTGKVAVILVWGEASEQRDTVIIEPVALHFTNYSLAFTAGAATEQGHLVIVNEGNTPVRVAAVSLMPADNVKGFRPDVLDVLQKLDSPVYRWPGGNFVSGYDWRDGLGDPDKRPTYSNPAWTGIETNDVGIHEFMDFCRLINTEPFIAVNTGFGDAHSAAEEVEYCNGTTDTPMGQWRAKNGHPDPFKVTWWAVGNEMYGDWQLGHMKLEHYILKQNQVESKMKAVDPSIKTVASGWANEWSRGLLEKCSDNMDLISEHFYCGDRRTHIPEHVAQVPDKIKGIAETHREYRKTIPVLAGKDIRIALDEWNYWYGPNIFGELGTRYFLKDALGIAAGLHEFFRNSDMYFMANYAQTVNVIGAIKTTKTGVFMESTGHVLTLYRREFGTIPVEVTYDDKSLDVMAAWTADGSALTIGVVNPEKTTKTIQLKMNGAALSGKGVGWVITSADPQDYNDITAPDKIAPKEVPVDGFTGTMEFPPYSITLYKVEAAKQ